MKERHKNWFVGAIDEVYKVAIIRHVGESYLNSCHDGNIARHLFRRKALAATKGPVVKLQEFAHSVVNEVLIFKVDIVPVIVEIAFNGRVAQVVEVWRDSETKTSDSKGPNSRLQL